MSSAMSQASLAVFEIGLNALAAVLDKAEAHASAKKIDPSVLTSWRLAPDMFGLARQVQIASDQAKNGSARLAGVEPPRYEDNETTFAAAEGADRENDRLPEDARSCGDRCRRRSRRHVSARPRQQGAHEGPGLSQPLRAAELLFPPHRRLRHPAPMRRRARQAGFPRRDPDDEELSRGGGPETAMRKNDVYWWSDAPLMAPEPKPVPAAADVVIVGAGYTGLAAAIRLARAGRSVQVFDRQRPGEGASTRNGGITSGNLRPGHAELAKRFGEDRAAAILAEAKAAREDLYRFIAEERIDCDFALTGRFSGASAPGRLRPARTRRGGVEPDLRHRGLRRAARRAARRARDRFLPWRHGSHGHRRAAPGEVPRRPAAAGARGRRRRAWRDGRPGDFEASATATRSRPRAARSAPAT